MKNERKKVRVAIPIGEVTESPYQLSPRYTSLEGLRIGMVDNKKPGSDILLSAMGEVLKREHGVQEVVLIHKPASVVPVSEASLDELARCDAVIGGVGD